jgi:hypothetical protein
LTILDKSYFKKVNSSIILDAYKCEVFVPDSYFESRLAVQDGEIYNLFFILKYKLYHTDKDSGSKNYGDFLFPSIVTTKPDDIHTVELDLYGELEKFHVFTYYKGSPIMNNSLIVKTSIMVERFVNLRNDGKIRAFYGKIPDIENKVQKIHDTKVNVPQYIEHLTISEVYRDKTDYSKPARIIMTTGDKDNSKVKALNMRENSAFTSTLAGVSFEDVKSMLTVADNRNDKNSKEIGPIEKVIKGVKDSPTLR